MPITRSKQLVGAQSWLRPQPDIMLREQPSATSEPGCKTLLAIAASTSGYRRATKVRQTTLEQAKTVLSTSRTLSQATKVRLRYKRVDFLGTANRIPMVDMLIFMQVGR